MCLCTLWPPCVPQMIYGTVCGCLCFLLSRVRLPSTERSPPLRPHLWAGGDDLGVAPPSQEEEEAGQEPVSRQQQGFTVCEWHCQLLVIQELSGYNNRAFVWALRLPCFGLVYWQHLNRFKLLKITSYFYLEQKDEDYFNHWAPFFFFSNNPATFINRYHRVKGRLYSHSH